jgi:hypothetical protein
MRNIFGGTTIEILEDFAELDHRLD